MDIVILPTPGVLACVDIRRKCSHNGETMLESPLTSKGQLERACDVIMILLERACDVIMILRVAMRSVDSFVFERRTPMIGAIGL